MNIPPFDNDSLDEIERFLPDIVSWFGGDPIDLASLDPRDTVANNTPFVLGHPDCEERLQQSAVLLPCVNFLYLYPEIFIKPNIRGAYRPFLTAIFYKCHIWRPYIQQLSRLHKLGVGFAEVLRQLRFVDPENLIEQVKEDSAGILEYYLYDLAVSKLEYICNFPWATIKPHYSLFKSTAIWVQEELWYETLDLYLSDLGDPSVDYITKWKQFIVQYKAARAAAEAQAQQYIIKFVSAWSRRRVDRKSLLGIIKYSQAGWWE
jgi:hypothetical protein